MKVKLIVRDSDLRQFYKYLFPTEKNCLIITRNSDVGLFMCANVLYRDFPDIRNDDTILDIILPLAPSTSSAHRKHCFFTYEAEAKINDYTRAVMRLDFRNYWVEGQIRGFKRKDIIESYILSRGLYDLNFESIGKNGYRQNIRMFENKVKSYYDKANHISNLIRVDYENYKKVYSAFSLFK